MKWKAWEKRGKRGLTRLAGRALRARARAAPWPDLAGLERILLIRQQNQLGDLLLSTPAIRAVRARARRARIDFVSGPANQEALLGNRHLDEVILYDKKLLRRRPPEARRFLKRLREARYELAIVMSTVSFSYTSAWLAALSGAERRAGRPGPAGEGAKTAREIYDYLLAPPAEGRHQTALNLDLVRPFGAHEADPRPELFLTPGEELRGARALRSVAGRSGGGLRVVIHPGAGKLPNRWPAERFGKLARALLLQRHRVAVACGPGEEDLLEAMERGAGRSLPRLPALDVRTFAGVLRAADLLVANDTGVLHLGAAVGTVVLALFGPTDPAIWCPASPRVRFLRAPGGDLARLPAEAVVRAAVGLAAHLGGVGELPPSLAPAPAWTP